jgi:hypothetical protein
MNLQGKAQIQTCATGDMAKGVLVDLSESGEAADW